MCTTFGLYIHPWTVRSHYPCDTPALCCYIPALCRTCSVQYCYLHEDSDTLGRHYVDLHSFCVCWQQNIGFVKQRRLCYIISCTVLLKRSFMYSQMSVKLGCSLCIWTNKMHKIPVIRLYFPLDALHVSDYISPSSEATFISCTSHLVHAGIIRVAYTGICDVQLIKLLLMMD